MKLKSLVLTVLVAGVLAGVAVVGQQTEPAGAKMASAAQKFLNSLTPKQKEKATFPFNSKERVNWNFVPMQDKKRTPTRKGLPMFEMTPKQKKLAIAMVAAGTSQAGKKKALSIMALEGVLKRLETNGRMVRNPQWYFLTVFGTPSKTGKWGWRIEGHHLSLNYTMDGGKVVSATPTFFGANPAIAKKRFLKGMPLETLPECEHLARKLYLSLDKAQRKVAHRDKTFGEPKQGTAYAKVGEPVGLPAVKMNGKQRDILNRLLQSYAGRMPADIGHRQMQEVKAGGFDKIHFAWGGKIKPGQPHTYRVQGPSFVIEFLNTQPSPDGRTANHIHSVWRELGGDFGIGRK